MSEKTQKAAQIHRVDGTVPNWRAVRAYLLENPQQLSSDQDLLARLCLKYAPPNISEFLPVALARSEALWKKEQGIRRALENLAQSNLETREKAQKLVVEILKSQDNMDLVRRLRRATQEYFAIHVVLAVESETFDRESPKGWAKIQKGVVDSLLGSDQTYFVGPYPPELGFFEDLISPIQSAAFLKLSLWEGKSSGLLVFGSCDPQGFTPDLNPELILFIARVLEITASRWPHP